MQGGAKLKEQLSTAGSQRNKAQLIQNDQLVFEGGGHEFGQTMVVLGQNEVVDQGGDIVETDAMTLPTGR